MKKILLCIFLTISFSGHAGYSEKKAMKAFDKMYDGLSEALARDGFQLSYEEVKKQIRPVFEKDFTHPNTVKLIDFLLDNKSSLKTKFIYNEIIFGSIMCNWSSSYSLQVFADIYKFNLTEFQIMEFRRKATQACVLSKLEMDYSKDNILSNLQDAAYGMGRRYGELVEEELNKRDIHFKKMSPEEQDAAGEIMTRLADIMRLALESMRK